MILFRDLAALEARRTLVRGPLAPLADSLAAELAPWCLRPPAIDARKARLTRQGGRCAADQTVLTFDPAWIKGKGLAGTVVFFDGDCALCHGFVRFLLAEDRASVVQIAPLNGATFAPKTSDVRSLRCEDLRGPCRSRSQLVP